MRKNIADDDMEMNELDYMLVQDQSETIARVAKGGFWAGLGVVALIILL